MTPKVNFPVKCKEPFNIEVLTKRFIVQAVHSPSLKDLGLSCLWVAFVSESPSPFLRAINYLEWSTGLQAVSVKFLFKFSYLCEFCWSWWDRKGYFVHSFPQTLKRGTEAPQILRTTDLSTSLLAQQFRPFIKWKIKCVGSGVNQQGSNPSSTHWISYWSLHFFISLSCPWKVSGRANRIMNVKNFSTLALCQ